MKTIISGIKIAILLFLGILSSIVFTIAISLVIGIEPFQESFYIANNSGTLFASWMILSMAFAAFLAGTFMVTVVTHTLLDLAIYFAIIAISGMICISRLDISNNFEIIAYSVNGVLLLAAIICIVIHTIQSRRSKLE